MRLLTELKSELKSLIAVAWPRVTRPVEACSTPRRFRWYQRWWSVNSRILGVSIMTLMVGFPATFLLETARLCVGSTVIADTFGYSYSMTELVISAPLVFASGFAAYARTLRNRTGEYDSELTRGMEDWLTGCSLKPVSAVVLASCPSWLGGDSGSDFLQVMTEADSGSLGDIRLTQLMQEAASRTVDFLWSIPESVDPPTASTADRVRETIDRLSMVAGESFKDAVEHEIRRSEHAAEARAAQEARDYDAVVDAAVDSADGPFADSGLTADKMLLEQRARLDETTRTVNGDCGGLGSLAVKS